MDPNNDDLPVILEDDDNDNDELENIGDATKEGVDDDDDGEDAVDALDEDNRAALLESTSQMRSALTKVCVRSHLVEVCSLTASLFPDLQAHLRDHPLFNNTSPHLEEGLP